MSDLYGRGTKVVQQLCLMRFGDVLGCLEFQDDLVFHDKVSPEDAGEFTMERQGNTDL